MILSEILLSPDSLALPSQQSVELTSSNLPIVIIDTSGRTIQDQVRIQASMRIIYNGCGNRNYVTDPANNFSGRIAIELRGSSSISYPQKAYRLETQDASGENQNVSLIGMPKENDWILYAPYDDQSLIRNVLAYRLSNDMGRYASRTRFCELILNNEYGGLYILMEKIKQDKNRVNITPMDSSAISGDELSGGYIIKVDKVEGENVGGWSSSCGVFYQYHEPQADEILPVQKNYIRSFMNQFENAMTRPDMSDSSVGYPKYIDVPSFVDHFILSEFCKNIDAYRISSYMFKERDSKGGKLNAGPIWDFNLSLGKTWFSEDAYRVDEWEVNHNNYKPYDSPKVPFWWEKLGHDHEFGKHVDTRWRQLRENVLREDSLYHRIDLLVDSLSEARARHFQRWPEVAWGHSYEKEIQMMKEWINNRIQWIEVNVVILAAISDPIGSENLPGGFKLEQNYPNPFNSATTIEFNLPRTDFVTLKVYDLLGQEVTTLVAEKLAAGTHKEIWDAKGLASGVYLYRLEGKDFTLTRKLTALK